MIFSSERQAVRFIHTGDLHLDSPFSRLPIEKSEERRREMRETFGKLMQLVREEHADLLLIAGDVFDREYRTSATTKLLLDEFGACPRCQIVIAPGNHDPYTADSLWASGRLPSNVHVYSTEGLQSFVFPELNTAVYGWAFCSERLEMSPLSGRHAEDPTRLNLICGHCDIGVPLSGYGPVMEEDVAGFGAQYAAFAHRHVPQPPVAAGAGALYAYCGCLEGRSYDEPGRGGVILGKAQRSEKGWTLQTERVELSKRRYQTEKVNLTGVSTQQEVARRIKAVVEQKHYGADTALRVIFTGATPPDFSVPKQADGSMLGLYALELFDNTSPVYDTDYLEKDLRIRGEFYRTISPHLTSGTAEERATAARALRIGMAALEGNDITDL